MESLANYGSDEESGDYNDTSKVPMTLFNAKWLRLLRFLAIN